MRKVNAVLILLMLAGAGVVSAAEYRNFMDTEGRAIRGRILRYDARSEKVTIERDNKRSTTVPITIFSKADQNYIIEWNAAKGFLSTSIFKISCDDREISKRKEEEIGDIVYTTGSVEKDFVKTVIAFEETAFELTFQNRNPEDLENMRMDYRIYYEQSEMVWDEKPETLLHCFSGKMTLPTVPSKGTVSVLSKSVEIHKDSINTIRQAGGDQRQPGKGDVIGFRGRIYMEMTSGEEVMREISLPKTLSLKKYPWDAPEVEASAKVEKEEELPKQ